MKKFSFELLLLASTLLLSSCFFPGGRGVIFDDSGSKTDALMEQVFDILERKDHSALKAMFSPKALNEANDFEINMEYLFELFQGEIISWKKTSRSGETKNRYGKKSIQAISRYTVTTDKDEYLFLIVWYTRDDFDADNIGVQTLRVLRTDDKETQFKMWEEMITTPGIYKPEE